MGACQGAAAQENAGAPLRGGFGQGAGRGGRGRGMAPGMAAGMGRGGRRRGGICAGPMGPMDNAGDIQALERRASFLEASLAAVKSRLSALLGRENASPKE
jgi:hypothetical protein